MSTIPEAAVEAARQAFGKHAEWRYRQNWNARGTCMCGETLPETGNIHHEFGYHQMTKVLEAAAPIIRAEAWEEGYDELRECCGMCPKDACPWDITRGGKGPVNPYRKDSK